MVNLPFLTGGCSVSDANLIGNGGLLPMKDGTRAIEVNPGYELTLAIQLFLKCARSNIMVHFFFCRPNRISRIWSEFSPAVLKWKLRYDLVAQVPI